MTDEEQQQQLTIRLPRGLHLRVKIKVARKRTSIAAVVRECLERWVEDDGGGKGKKTK